MAGAGNLSRKQEQAVAALLSEPTVAAAASNAGVAERTLWRWLQVPEFHAEYRAARRRVVEGAIGQLQRATVEAVETLRRNLNCGSPSTEVRAALGILDQAVRGVELLDIEELLSELETRAGGA
jgi:hypothetical protein